ncbi:enoyl-CoA hydratase-related protein [Geobacillus thermodenitrificans]|jgi:2-(1,2-epoxy-1,2-dihydrophenyl)acetyl-CoA isomerase|uniref:Enoyl CoA hydratase n=1 Tax=Geobacillus thermodenitrificans (strain NG80-2) TaxID=420246 RepID=A4IPM4_GEOTN|nr:enoyl-CoA hydratase-related protein [Geobacillus thermodenitrificans]ABO67278.1 Enoyl CoA hydratase [Geobacillus thermodenitrificans NG80-2]MED0662054.1 2-(1,2-epoxy-1,2-dihydrophenyl)acetyl-CoA isomerase [Geobacillus thermodenitrificans]MED3718948.1 enoyl-CoA hydratase-related protein [Geobacillus thermodenitrificans]PJW19328.1 2-(1,2-epoxy-1,2-dihydrophenyl)acetyl-CoA isomerase [Geobacillus thermodenitrificans]
MYETIRYEVDGQVAWLTLNRPEQLNSFTEQMNKEMTKALKQAGADRDVRCVVITGAGRAFCAGEDLSGVTEEMDHGEVLRTRYAPMMKALYSLGKPVVAAVNGVAAGAGMSLALACDFRLLSEKASFAPAFIHVGLVPDAGHLYYLPRLIGTAKALELAVLGEKVAATEAVALGLATTVIPQDRWEEEVRQFAERLAAMPTKAIGLVKRLLHESQEATFDRYLEREAECQRIAGLTADHREGVKAFFEKRKPIFQGN